jgi:hypothetical protein
VNFLEAPPTFSPFDDFTLDAMLKSTLELYRDLVNHPARGIQAWAAFRLVLSQSGAGSRVCI